MRRNAGYLATLFEARFLRQPQEKIMKILRFAQLLVLTMLLALAANVARAQTSTFTYQGRLTDGGAPPTGTYDIQFKLYDALTAGSLQGSPNTVSKTGVNVTNGIFTVQLDFGASGFPGADRFLDIGVKHPADSTYTPLAPRQQLTSSPYAIHSLAAANLAISTSGATPSVTNLTVLVLNYSSTTTITDLTGGVSGQCVALINAGSAGSVPINNAVNFKLSSNWTAASDDTLTVCRYNGFWYETARKNPSVPMTAF
jgi:hypothetical protein